MAAPEVPGGQHRAPLEAQFAWATSLGGMFDLVCALPGIIALVHGPAGLGKKRHAEMLPGGFRWGLSIAKSDSKKRLDGRSPPLFRLPYFG